MRSRLLSGRRWLAARAPGAAAVGVALAAGLTAVAIPSGAATHPGSGTQAPLRITGSTGLTGAPAAPAAPVTSQRPQDATVMLPTGDRVHVVATGTGAQLVTPVPAGSVHGVPTVPATFLRFTFAGDDYVIPDAAVPYLHSTLDPRLFDVSYLARTGLGTGRSAGLPVRITYASAAMTASLPGVRVTHRSGMTATATITSAQAVRFGQLLATQWHAARTGRTATPVGKLPGIARITLAPPPGSPPLPASPARAPTKVSGPSSGLPFYTLKLKATNLNGKPGVFAGIVQNVGDAALSSPTGYITDNPATGEESLSVPKGTYSLGISVVTPAPSGSAFDTALVVKPQVTVDSDTTVTLDARTAVPYQAEPKPAISTPMREDVLNFWRTSVTGGGMGSIGNSGFPLGLIEESPNPCSSRPECFYADRLLATPTAPVTKGSFLFDATTQLYSGLSTPGPSYEFDFPHLGSIPSSLSYTVPASDLTAVHRRIYQSPPGASCGSPGVIDFVYLQLGGGAWTSFNQAPGFDAAAVPGLRTDYWYSSDPRLDLWQPIDFPPPCPILYGQPQHIAPGQQITEVWDKAPMVPAPTAPPRGDGGYSAYTGNPLLGVCVACRQGDIGTVNVLPYGDSDPSHFSDAPVFDVQSPVLLFYRDGRLATDSATEGAFVGGVPWGLELPLLSHPASYRLDYTETPTGNSSSPGTVETDWTFRSGPAGPALPRSAGECDPDPAQACSFLPLLYLRYNLALGYGDQAAAGKPERIGFTVTGQQYAPAPSGLSATVSASFDGGKTWTTPQNAASLGHGRFTATISQPPLSSTSGSVCLRVTARDGSGDSVTQTITPAYWLTK